MEKTERIGQQQFYDLLLSREMSWQEIIYDLIASEQLDPWDIDLGLLSSSYLEKIKKLEEANFFISSKVLLAASILLRIKSEMLLTRYMKSLDEILFGKTDAIDKKQERIILDGELPELIPRTPLPRMKKVTLPELMQALDRAIVTEQRRIKKELVQKQAQRNISIVLPKFRINIKDKIREIYTKIKEFFKRDPEKKLTFTLLAGTERSERIATFLPLLHLDNQSKVFLDQEKPFEEIYIWLKKQLAEIEKEEKMEIVGEANLENLQDVTSSENNSGDIKGTQDITPSSTGL
jgi:segregation and condensation protein A